MAEKSKSYKLSIDIDQMTLGDLELLEGAGRGEFSPFLNLLERVAEVDGLPGVRDIPIRDLREVVARLTEALTDAGNAGN